MAIAGATEPEIASVTGHTLRDIRRVLDARYLRRHPELAESAIRKLERGGTGTKSSNGLQTKPEPLILRRPNP
jgi:hypothetical protein